MKEKQTDLKILDSSSAYGLADAHGIETLVWHDADVPMQKHDRQQKAMLSIRAESNRHRHATYFEIKKVEVGDKIVLDRLLQLGKYISALTYLKGVSEEVRIPSNHSNSWELIPNPRLDPYYSVDEDVDEPSQNSEEN